MHFFFGERHKGRKKVVVLAAFSQTFQDFRTFSGYNAEGEEGEREGRGHTECNNISSNFHGVSRASECFIGVLVYKKYRKTTG